MQITNPTQKQYNEQSTINNDNKQKHKQQSETTTKQQHKTITISNQQ